MLHNRQKKLSVPTRISSQRSVFKYTLQYTCVVRAKTTLEFSPGQRRGKVHEMGVWGERHRDKNTKATVLGVEELGPTIVLVVAVLFGCRLFPLSFVALNEE